MQQLVNSLTVGAIYALVTVGYSMVFSVLNMINFAHTDIMMLGAYAGYLVAKSGAGIFPQLLTASVMGAVASVFIERVVYRPLYNKPPLKLMTAAIAVSVILQYLMMLIFTAQPRAYPTGSLSDTVAVLGVKTTELRSFAVGFATLMFAILALLVSKTKTGLHMRAATQDPLGAEVSGINRNKIISITFSIGGVAAAMAGVIYGNLYLITPLMSGGIGIKAFVCTVAGGKGSIWGAVLGALLLSFCETAVCVFFGSGYKDAVSFVILILFLLQRRNS